MPEDLYSSPAAPMRSSGGLLRAVLGSAFLAFIAGAALVGWLIWDGRVDLPGRQEPQLAAAGPDFSQPAPSPSASAAALAGQALDQHIAMLEQRLARIDLQAAAAEGNTARAEALLVALAARRSIERGAALGYLEDQLKLRFGTARPAAVATVIEAAKSPVTLDRLSADLDALAPALAGQGPEDSTWSRFRQSVNELFVVHRDAPGASSATTRIARAQVLLRTGQIEAAIEEIAHLPGSRAAEGWIAAARRYGNALTALDQIEQAALAEPEKLKAGTGESVRQLGPAAGPAAVGNSPAARQATF